MQYHFPKQHEQTPREDVVIVYRKKIAISPFDKIKRATLCVQALHQQVEVLPCQPTAIQAGLTHKRNTKRFCYVKRWVFVLPNNLL